MAAPTTSLPEWPGGDRNWDYRYSWPRDASLGVLAFGAVGRHHEAHAFMRWLLHSGRLSRPRLAPLYTLLGRNPPEEREADVAGYAGSRPVRIGNAAEHQHQLDVYGWVIDAAERRERDGGGRIDGETWRMVAGFADLLAERWPEPDAGIWESRDEPRHHVTSKLMAWLGLDRALGLADSHRTRASRRERWTRARDDLLNDVRARGMDPGGRTSSPRTARRTSTPRCCSCRSLGFAAPDAPEVVATVRAVRERLHAGGPLWYRHPPEQTTEGAFVACSFWMAEALARTGRTDEGASLLEDACARANDVGLFSEEIDPSSGDFLGNMPQALSHSALIEAALAVRDASATE